MKRPTFLPHLVIKPYRPGRKRRLAVIIGLLWLVSMLGCFQLTRSFAVNDMSAQTADLERTRASLVSAEAERETLQKRLAVLERSEQVATAATTELQQGLKEREEEVAAVRADLAFYERLVGGSARRQGLSVHSVGLAPIEGSRAFNVTVTLTQNMKKSRVVAGRLKLAVEGVYGDKLTTLHWNEVAQDGDSAGLPYSFKYFQQVVGSLMLPEGFAPNRLTVSVVSEGDGGQVEQRVPWTEALANEKKSDVQ